MKVQDLKNVLEIPFSVGKGFAPITEYLYFNNKEVKATNLESYLKVFLNENLPFSGCILSDPLKKFLNTVNKDTVLDFEVNNNVLTIKYGKKNKFNIPMESLNSFPESPSAKYRDSDLINSLPITKELIENFERAIKFVSDTDTAFNGLYLNGNKIYSSNREIIYSGVFDTDKDYSVFIPKDLVKYIIKFRENFEKIEIYTQGFRVLGHNMVLYFPNFGEQVMPNFDDILNNYEKLLIIKNTDELKDCVNRVKQFDAVTNISIKENTINFFTNNLNETIEFDNSIDKELVFKFNTTYLKMVLDMSDYIDILTNIKDSIQPKAIGGGTDKYRIVSATIL